MSLSRRDFLSAAALLAALGPSRLAAALAPATPITVHKDASCGCCEKWITHMRANGFKVEVRDEKDIDGVKDQLGVPKGVRSCHTALVGGYLVEGHVPASDVRKLLDTRPKVVGLAVPGMPSGTPGMEGPRGAERYEVLSWDARGATKLYARH